MANETVVEIKQDEPLASTEVVIDKTQAEKPGTKIVTADEGVAELKAQVERAKADSQRRLQEADRQIAVARQRALAAENEAVTVKTGAVATVLDSLAKDKEAARRDYKLAMESGDFEKAADATDRISEANARIEEAKRGKLEMEMRARDPNQGRQVAEVVNDPLDATVNAVGGPNSRSGQWFRQHPEFARENDKNEAVTRAHFAALGEGIAVESDEYFRFVERKLGIGVREPERDGRESFRAPTAAPVGRDVVQSPGAQRPGTVRLTASEVATAKALDMTLEDYARNKIALIAEGKIGRTAS